MTDAEKITLLRNALAPFADLIERPGELTNEGDMAFEVYVPDIVAAKDALQLTEPKV